MATSLNNNYTIDKSKDPELICNICRDYFKDPYSTQCDHTFCNQCITQRVHSGNSICPRCAKPITMFDIKPASRIIRDMLTRTRVICKYCWQQGIQREYFDDHLKRSCTKIEVSCPALDVYCPWRGQRDQLDNHLKSCIYNSLHATLHKLINENRQLKEEIQKLKQHYEEKNLEQTKDIENTESFLQSSIKQLNEQINRDQDRIEKHDIEIEHLKNQIIQMDIQIKKLQEENHLKQMNTLKLTQLCSQHEVQIRQLTKRLNLIVELIGYHNVTLIDRIETCTNRLMSLNQKKLNDQDMLIIVQQAILKKHCKELNLQCNEITSQGASILADGLINDQYLEILYLHDNHISDIGVQYLSESLATKNLTLKTLDLGSNNITDDGAEYLAEMLKTNQTVIHLYLRNNNIGDRGLKALTNALAFTNKTLEELVLDQNKMISDVSIEYLIEMFIQNHTLKNTSDMGM